jgi:plasmid stability protein
MAQLVVRNIDEGVKKRLKVRAARNGRSLEGEVRDILSGAVKKPPARRPKAKKGFGTRLVEIFAGKVPSDFKIPDIRSEPPRPAKFDE